MTQPFDDEHGEILRRALHAEADAVTPSPEGLERIRSKINTRHERRWGFFSYSTPWLRPLAAVAAALAVCVVAVSVTPALANFVQTGHFSPDAGSSDGNASSKDGHAHGGAPPSGSSAPAPSGSPSPTTIHPSNTGKHVVNGSTCPPGENTVTPSTAPTPAPTPKVTCQAPPSGDTPPPPVTEPPTPPVTTPPDVPPPSDQPTSQSAPEPNQSP